MFMRENKASESRVLFFIDFLFRCYNMLYMFAYIQLLHDVSLYSVIVTFCPVCLKLSQENNVLSQHK